MWSTPPRAIYDFGDIDEAARDAEEGKVVKPVLRMMRGAPGLGASSA
jgi:hypothetical protein